MLKQAAAWNIKNKFEPLLIKVTELFLSQIKIHKYFFLTNLKELQDSKLKVNFSDFSNTTLSHA